MIAILGSGFGLYGYFPALVEGCRRRVILPEPYRARLGERPELARFCRDVQWEPDEATALDCADGVVLALRPIDQMNWVPRCLARANLECLLLEKPLASSPEVAAELGDALARSNKVIRIGYTFRYTEWGRRLLDVVSKPGERRPLFIQWSFLAHHFRLGLHNWKRFTISGGGAIRFYGIQLIALLAEIGYRDVLLSHSFGQSVDELEKWTASFAGPALPECDIVVDTRAAPDCFRVELLSRNGTGIDAVIANQSDPFDSLDEPCQSGGLDRRVPTLARLCRSLWEPGRNESVWYAATIELWRRIEEKTQFAMCGEELARTRSSTNSDS